MAQVPATDYETQVCSKIWELLLARTPFASKVPPGNRIRYDTAQGLANPEKENPTDSDMYEAVLFPSSGEDSLYTDSETFETYSPGGPSHWVERQSFKLTLVITSPWMGVQGLDYLCAEARAGIRKGGPRLGLAYVDSVKLEWRTTREVRPADDNTGSATLRWVSEITISVECEHDGAAMLGEQ